MHNENLDFLQQLVAQLPPDFDPRAAAYRIQDGQELGADCKAAQTKRIKLIDLEKQMQQLIGLMERPALEIAHFEDEIVKRRSILGQIGTEVAKIQQSYAQEVYAYGHRLSEASDVLNKIALNMYQTRNAKTFADFYKQLSILWTEISRGNEKIDEATGTAQSLDAIKEELKNIVRNSFLKNVGLNQPVPMQIQPSQPQATIIPQTNPTTPSNTINMAIDGLFFTPQTPSRPLLASSTQPIVTSVSTKPQSVFNPFGSDSDSYTPVDINPSMFSQNILTGKIFFRKNPIQQEFDNVRAGNLVQTKEQLAPKLPGSIIVLNEGMYSHYAEKFGWCDPSGGNDVLIILVTGLLSSVKSSSILEKFLTPHAFTILEQRLDQIGNEEGQIIGCQESVRANGLYMYNQEATNTGLTWKNIETHLEHNQYFIAVHDKQYKFLAGVCSLIMTISSIFPHLEGNVALNETFYRYIHTGLFWSLTQGQISLDVSGDWISSTFQPGQYGQSPTISTHKTVTVTFDLEKIYRINLIFERVIGIVTQQQIDGEFNPLLHWAPVTFTQEEELLINGLKEKQIAVQLITLFCRGLPQWLTNKGDAFYNISMLDHPHWLVIFDFENEIKYASYQTSFMNALHYSNSKDQNSLAPYFAKPVIFDPDQLYFGNICTRTSVVKGTTKKKVPDDQRLKANHPLGYEPRRRGRPRRFQYPSSSSAITRDNFRNFPHTAQSLQQPDPEEQRELSVSEKTQLLKNIRTWLDNIAKDMCNMPRIQHSYLHLRIPRTNIPGAPVPLSVPPYALLSENARMQVRAKYAAQVKDKSVVYATDLLNVENIDTFFSVNGCADDFVRKMEQNGFVTQEDLLGAKCRDCKRPVRLTTSSAVNRKRQNAIHCFGYIPCHCRKLTTCMRCYIVHWLWNYNLDLKRTSSTSSSKAASEFSLPCIDCKVPWQLSQLCLVSFDHLCAVSGLDIEFPYNQQPRARSLSEPRPPIPQTTRAPAKPNHATPSTTQPPQKTIPRKRPMEQRQPQVQRTQETIDQLDSPEDGQPDQTDGMDWTGAFDENRPFYDFTSSSAGHQDTFEDGQEFYFGL